MNGILYTRRLAHKDAFGFEDEIEKYWKQNEENKNEISLKKKRLELVNLSKNIVKEYGWNDSLFENVSFHNRISYDELIILFPDGYKEMLKLSLDYLNYETRKYM